MKAIPIGEVRKTKPYCKHTEKVELIFERANDYVIHSQYFYAVISDPLVSEFEKIAASEDADSALELLKTELA